MTTAKGNRRSRGAKLHLSFESMEGTGLGMVIEFNREWLDLTVAFVANMPAFRGYLAQSGFNQLLCWEVVKLDDIQNLACRIVPYQPRDRRLESLWEEEHVFCQACQGMVGKGGGGSSLICVALHLASNHPHSSTPPSLGPCIYTHICSCTLTLVTIYTNTHLLIILLP